MCPAPPCSQSPDRLYSLSTTEYTVLIVADASGMIRAAARPVAGWTLRYHLDQVSVAAARRGAALTPLCSGQP